MSLSVTNFGVMRGQHNATVSAKKNQICTRCFCRFNVSSNSITLHQFKPVYSTEEKYLDMSWPLSLISDVVLFKFSPVKNINSSEILFWYHTAEYTGQHFLLPSCLCNPLV